MTEQAIWGAIITAVVVIGGGWAIARDAGQSATAGKRFDWLATGTLAMLLVFLLEYRAGWAPLAALTINAILSAALGALFLTARWAAPRIRSKGVRIAIVGAACWVTAVQLWGFIWNWGSVFRADEFAMLNASAPLMALIAWVGFHWIRKA